MKSSVIRIAMIAVLIAISSIITFSQTNDRPVKVTKFTRAEYTGEARGRMIQGWIKLRVTMKADGTLGDIYYVDESDPEKNLSKYGLLKNCYEAAKKIQFQPAIQDGEPVTVTKVLQYNFALGQRPEDFRRRP